MLLITSLKSGFLWRREILEEIHMSKDIIPACVAHMHEAKLAFLFPPYLPPPQCSRLRAWQSWHHQAARSRDVILKQGEAACSQDSCP